MQKLSWFWIGREDDLPAGLGASESDALFDDVLYPWDQPMVAGVDEVGRGCLAGPVCAAAVILNPQEPIAGLNDSKKLSAPVRTALAEEIRAKALAWAVAWGSVEEIDTINILQSTMRTMVRAVEALTPAAQFVLIDGNRAPKGLHQPVSTLVKGDARVAQIAAASILAKTARDALMVEMDQTYPGYGFAQHVGYGTAQHLAALEKLGPCAIHRQTFGPVKRLLKEEA